MAASKHMGDRCRTLRSFPGGSTTFVADDARRFVATFF